MDWPADKSAGLFKPTEIQMTTAVSSDKLPTLGTPQLPDEPLFVVEARKSWVGINLRDLWAMQRFIEASARRLSGFAAICSRCCAT